MYHHYYLLVTFIIIEIKLLIIESKMMDNSQKFLKMLSDFIEAGILTSQDLKKELLTSIKFKKESLANSLDLVTREEFIILKKLIEKQQKEIHNLKKNKLRKFKKGKRS